MQNKESLLIVECCSKELSRQSLSVGSSIYNFLTPFFSENPIELIETNSEKQLLGIFEKLASTNKKFDNIIIIGHSNENGLNITSDRFINWDGAAEWFKLLNPKRIFLMACRASRLLPRSAIFDGVPTLEEIYGSPVPIGKPQIPFIVGIIWRILSADEVDPEYICIAQVANLIFTKKLMWKYTREGFESDSFFGDVLQLVGEPLLEEITNKVLRNRDSTYPATG